MFGLYGRSRRDTLWFNYYHCGKLMKLKDLVMALCIAYFMFPTHLLLHI